MDTYLQGCKFFCDFTLGCDFKCSRKKSKPGLKMTEISSIIFCEDLCLRFCAGRKIAY